MIVGFCPEEQAEAYGETLTLRLDYRAVTTIEGALEAPFPVAVAQAIGPPPSYGTLSRILWACLREHHPDISIDQCLAMAVDKSKDGAKVGFALNALLERFFPTPEDRKPKNAPKKAGRSKVSAEAG